MRFCTHCGAQVPDNSKFCTACGTPIDAPDEATVVISDPEEEVVEASDTEGEFTAASWSPEPAAQPVKQPQPKKKGFFSYVWLFIKVLIIAILAVMVAVFLRGVYIGYTSSAEEPHVTVEDDGFQSLSDLSVQDRIEYLKALLDRSYEELDQLNQQGDGVDEKRLHEVGLRIQDLHAQLDELQQ